MSFFKMSTNGHFLPISLYVPSTPYTKQKQKKLLKQLQKQYNLKTFRRQPFHYVTLAQSNYYQNLFHTILCAVGYHDIHASKYNTDASFILQKHNRALCNSLKNLKTIKGPYSGPNPGHKPRDLGHSSNTFHLDSL